MCGSRSPSWTRAACAGFAYAVAAAANASDPLSLGFIEAGRTILGIDAAAQSRFAVADLDGDGLDDLVFCGTSFGAALFVVGRQPGGTVGFKQVRTIADDGGVARVFVSGSADNRHVYTVSYSGMVRDYSGWPLQQVDQFELGTGLMAAAIGDLYGNGGSNLVALTVDHLNAYSLDTHALLWSYAIAGGQDVVLAQLDSDPGLEIVVAASPGLVIDAATQSVEWQYANASGFGDYLATGHLTGDTTTQFVGSMGTSFTVFRSEPWNAMWSVGNIPGGIGVLATANLDHNNHDVILEGDSQWGAIHAYDSSTHQLRFTIDNPSWGVNAVTSADIDGDGVAEIAFASSQAFGVSMEIVDSRSGTIKWTFTPGGGPFTPLAYGDVDGDGNEDLVVADVNGDWYGSPGVIQVFDAATGAFEWKSPKTGGGVSDPFYIKTSRILLRQHSADPAMDIILVGNSSYDGKVVWIDGATHAVEFQVYGFGVGVLASRDLKDAALVDYDDDGTMDVVVASSANFGAGDALLQVLSGTDGHILWASPAMNSNINTVLVTGSAANASGELVAVLTDGLAAYNIQDPSSTWTLLAAADCAAYIPQGLAGAEFALFEHDGAVAFYDATTRTYLRGFALLAPLNSVLPVDNRADLLLAASADRVMLVDGNHGTILAGTEQLGGNLALDNQIVAAKLGEQTWRLAAGDEFGVTRFLLQMVPDRLFAADFESGN